MLRKHVSTRRRLGLEALEDRLCLSSLPVGTSATVPDAATQAHLSAAYGQLPLSFEANQGQTDSQVNFLSRGAGYSLFLTPTKAVLSLKQGDTSNVVGMRMVGANPASRAVGLDKQAGVSNYFIGNDPSKWHTERPQLRPGCVQGCLPGHRPGLPRQPEAARVRLRRRPRRRPPRHPAGLRRHPIRLARPCGQPGPAHLRRRRGRARAGRVPGGQRTAPGGGWPVRYEWAIIRWASRSAVTTTASRW